MDVGGKPQGQTFVLGGPEQRTVTITSNGPQTAVVAGIDNLTLMRTAGFLSRRVGPRPDDGLTMRCRRCSSAACRRSGPTAMPT